jgi:N-acetylglucosaminyl-diphospho-decaprenol L-rhamnosyltransferase
MVGEMGQRQVSVVVVSYNTREQLRRCLAAIEPEHEIVVVDNASSDGSAAMVAADFPHATLIENGQNKGFGAANNQGMDRATGDLILLLNSDCYAEPGAIARLAGAFQDPGVVAAGGQLSHMDGRLQESVAGPLTLWNVFLEQTLMEIPLRPIGWGYWRTLAKLTEWASRSRQGPLVGVPVHQVMGACLMLRPLERFDERFFLYCEDTELCLRLRRRGLILYVPKARFAHELGSSSAGEHRWRSVALYNRGKELYFEIHGGAASAATCLLLDRLGALLRFAVWGTTTLLTLGMAPPLRNRMRLFWRVLTAPRKGPRPDRPRAPRP